MQTVHAHNDLIMTAGQAEAAGSLRFHRRETRKSSIVADPLEGLAVQRLVAGCEGTTPKALIRHRKMIGTCKAVTAARFATEIPKCCTPVSTRVPFGVLSRPRRASDATIQKMSDFYAIFICIFGYRGIFSAQCRFFNA